MITIKEIAEKLGVSPTTVSNVIHGKTKEVSLETVDKVNQIIREYNYIPNMNARNLAGNVSKIIAVVIKYRKILDSNFVQDPFTSELLGAVESQIRKNRYYTMLYLSDQTEEILRFVSTWNVDGLVVVGFWPDECQEISSAISKPMVFVDGYFNNDGIEYINVGLEDEKGGYDIAKYLVDNGHKKIGFITDNQVGVYKARFDGYLAALREAGIDYKDNYLISINQDKTEFEKCLEEIYSRRKEFNSLLCVSDYYAVRIINFMLDRGVKIPDEISITGFDDNITGKTVRPALTTMRQNPTEKGYLAVEQLMKAINGIAIEKKNILLTAELVIRDTVKNLNLI